MGKTRFAHASAFGTVSAMAVVVLGLILYMVDMSNSALNNLSYPIAITIACIGVKKWREQSGGYLSFGQTYGHLFFQTLIYSAILTVWTLVFIVYIAPGMMEQQMLIQQAKMEDDGKMTQEQIEMAMHYARMFTSPGMIAVFAFFGNIILLGLINLIVAAIMKKDPPPTPFFPPSDGLFQNPPTQPMGNNPYQQSSSTQQNTPPQQ